MSRSTAWTAGVNRRPADRRRRCPPTRQRDAYANPHASNPHRGTTSSYGNSPWHMSVVGPLDKVRAPFQPRSTIPCQPTRSTSWNHCVSVTVLVSPSGLWLHPNQTCLRSTRHRPTRNRRLGYTCQPQLTRTIADCDFGSAETTDASATALRSCGAVACWIGTPPMADVPTRAARTTPSIATPRGPEPDRHRRMRRAPRLGLTSPGRAAAARATVRSDGRGCRRQGSGSCTPIPFPAVATLPKRAAHSHLRRRGSSRGAGCSAA